MFRSVVVLRDGTPSNLWVIRRRELMRLKCLRSKIEKVVVKASNYSGLLIGLERISVCLPLPPHPVPPHWLLGRD